MKAEIIIIGAGAAGLIAARESAAAGRDVLLLEARDRAGGRMLTIRDPRAQAPVELGAEFVHGSHELMLSLLEAAGIARQERPDDDDDEDWLQEKKIGELLKHVDELSEDMSLAGYVRRYAPDPAMRDVAEGMLAYAEGFDAADPEIISVEAFAEEWWSDASIRGSGSRLLDGYGLLVDFMLRSLGNATVHFRSVVERIEWKRGEVVVHAVREGTRETHAARRAIVTLPPSVMQERTIFDPPLPRETQEALRLLAMGPVYKVVMVLDEALLTGIEFVHRDETPFPALWHSLPNARTLTAWAGGPSADRLRGLSHEEIIRAAVVSAERALGMSLEKALENAYLHDWQRDPFALGAYSYARVGGLTARDTLAKPVEETLFIAGEACAGEGFGGTVAGALDTGMRTARAILSL